MGIRPVAYGTIRLRCAVALVAVSAALCGCAAHKVAFTQGIRTQYDLGNEDLKNLQYYVSSDITLQREFRREEGEVSQTHRLVAKESGLVDQVVIRAGTPGIATEVEQAYLAVSFEPGVSLMFGSPPTDWDPERKYKLVAKRWTATYGEIDYDGKIFHAVEGSRAAYLEVRLESLDAVKKQKKVLPGVTLPSK